MLYVLVPGYPHEGVHLLPLAGVPLLVMFQHVAPGHLTADVPEQGHGPAHDAEFQPEIRMVAYNLYVKGGVSFDLKYLAFNSSTLSSSF